MPQSEVIWTGIYTACAMRDGSLVVTGRKDGKRLIGPDAAAWIEAIRTALDANEANALCRAVYQA